MPGFWDKLMRRTPAIEPQSQPEAETAPEQQEPAGLLAMLQGPAYDNESAIKSNLEQSEVVRLILARFKPGASREERRESMEFELHCRDQFTAESYYYIREYYSFISNSDDNFMENARYLYTRYLAPSAAKELNISSELRLQIQAFFERDTILEREQMLRLMHEAAQTCLGLLRQALNPFRQAQNDRLTKRDQTFSEDVVKRLRRDDRIAAAKSASKIGWRHPINDIGAYYHASDREKQDRSFDEYVRKAKKPNKLMLRRNYGLYRKMGRDYDEKTFNNYIAMSGKEVYGEFRPVGRVQFDEEDE